MICLLNGHESSLWTLTLIFYTCIWIPFRQIKSLLHEIMIIGFDKKSPPQDDACQDEGDMWSPDLLVAKFEHFEYPKIRSSNSNNSNDNIDDDCDDHELTCSICLVEFQKEDVVSQLPRCGHFFHEECIQSWLDRDQFTCPLCRSSFLQTLNPR